MQLPMRRIGLLVCLAGVLVLTLAACGTPGGGSSGTDSSTITMGPTGFTGNTTISIAAGKSVTFDDTTGGTHDLVTGSNGTFASVNGAPSEFSTSDGLDLKAGDKKSVIFAHAGTYHITCVFHPSMQATITVSDPASIPGY